MIVYGLNWQIVTVLIAKYTVMLCFVAVICFILHTSRKNTLVQKKYYGRHVKIRVGRVTGNNFFFFTPKS